MRWRSIPDAGVGRRSRSANGVLDVESVITIDIRTRPDVDLARREVRRLAASAGLNFHDVEMVALAVTELAFNLVRYAQGGSIVLSRAISEGRTGVQIESRDTGPGIDDLVLAMQDNYSTGGGLGSGLPAVKRLMDEFTISSTPKGTRVIARKWMTPNRR
ncbi:MAG TPA: ATP-binding protein [Thermomicrobiales bacterium]|nr:ATP-binding protein [Thermomicrobiales bacterium]